MAVLDVRRKVGVLVRSTLWRMTVARPKKEKTPKVKKPRKPRQARLPGMEPEKNPAIERLAEAYVEVRNRRMVLTKEEVGKRDLLQVKMHESGLKSYEYDGKIVELVGVEKVKVRSSKDGGDEDEEDES